eukprot:jgi/Chrzof1/6641/Cz19g04010.t1
MIAPDCHQQFAENVVANTYPHVQLKYISYYLNCTFVELDKPRAATAGPVHGVWMILEALAKRTDDVLSNQTLIQELRHLARSSDLMVADPLGFGGLLAAHVDIPHIDLDVGTAGALFEPLMYGAQSCPSYVPAIGTFLPTNGMNVLQKLVNLVATTGARTLLHLVYRHPALFVQQMIKKHSLNISYPYLKPLLLLVNSNWVLEPPRPIAPQTKYIGPILPTPANPLPQELQEWADGSGALGLVYISFGGTLQAPISASRTVVRAMASLPDVRFIWKLTEAEHQRLHADLANLTNVLVRTWVPQNDLLGHPRLRAFVTQGGFLSIAEAAYHGVPIVGIPLIAGQGELIRYAADQGRGVFLHKNLLRQGNDKALSQALLTVLSQESYHIEAQKASLRLRAIGTPYRQQAADWVEYAVKVKDHGPFLHTQGQKMQWYEILLLDVLAAAAAVVSLPVVAIMLYRAYHKGSLYVVAAPVKTMIANKKTT